MTTKITYDYDTNINSGWYNNFKTQQSLTDITRSNSSDNRDNKSDFIMVVVDIVKIGINLAVTYYITSRIVKIIIDALDNPADRIKHMESKKQLAKRLNRPDIETMNFTFYEHHFLNVVISANEISTSFDDIGGMELELEEVKDNIVLPIKIWNRFKSYQGFSSCPSGVLLYGKPGTGKSLTAKAIAKDANATFINIKASDIMDKYLGESDRLVSALFSLSRKLAPTIVFIDEIETVLKKRDDPNGFSQTASSIQGVFLSEWDGLTVSQTENNESIPDILQGPVIILGATNRPQDLDSAFLRRMPVQIQMKMPDEKGRLSILLAQLKNDTIADDVNLEIIAFKTVDYSGSDIKELIRIAKQKQTKLYIQSAQLLFNNDKNDVISPSYPAKNVTNNLSNNKMKNTTDKINNSNNIQIKNNNNENVKINMKPISHDDFEYAILKLNDTIRNTQMYGNTNNNNTEDYVEKLLSDTFNVLESLK